MLAAQWLRSLEEEEVDVLWFRCDSDIEAGVGSVDRFWSLLASRLDEFGNSGRRAPGTKHLDGRERVLRHFAERTKPIYIVLDRYSELSRPESGLGHELTDLVRSTESLFLVVCTREVTTIEVVGAVMVDSLVLRPADLALRPEEIISLAAQRSISLTPEEARALCLATGGWPALIRVILTGSAAERRTGETFTLNLDAGKWFLRSVWKEFSDPQVRALVERTGFIGEFTLDIARELCPDADPKNAIDELVAAKILTVRSGSGGTVYSHLPAVRREVRQRLQHEDRERYRELSLLAAHVHRRRGQFASALSFLVRAQLWDAVLTLVEESWNQLSVQHSGDLVRMIRMVPDDVLISSPHLVAVLVQLVDGGAERIGAGRVGPESDSGLGASLVLDTNDSPIGGAAGSLDEQFARVPARVRKRLPAVMYEWAVAKLMAAQPAEALVYFEESNALAQRFEVPEMVDASSTGAALVNVLTGEIGQAKQWLESLSSSGQPDPDDRIERLGMRGLVDIVSGFVDIGRVGSRSEVLKVLEIPVQHEADDLWSLSLTIRSQAAIFAGQQFELLEEFDQAHTRLMERPTDDLMSAMLVAARVDLLLSLGQVFRARAVLNTVDPGLKALVVSRARVAYLAGDYGKAVLIASEALRNGVRPPRLKLGVLLTLASAEAARGRSTEVIQALREALIVAGESGFRTYFVFVRRELLREFSSYVPGLGELITHLDEHFPDNAFPAPSIIAELSEREREVLVELARARTLAGVAKALYLTTNTVKTHLRSIYRKLGTHSSGETIQRAIECGLIEPQSSSQD